MNRYIDVNIVIKKYIDTDIKKFNNSDVKIVLENLKQNILKAPSIDLVCCGECLYHKNFPTGNSPITCSLSWGGVFENDFCSYGERDNAE